MNSLKEKIKSMSAEQTSIKQERKSITFQGKRTMDPSVATATAALRGENLRRLYVAYAVLRGKDAKRFDPKYAALLDEPGNGSWAKYHIEKVIAEYKPEFDAWAATQAKREEEYQARIAVTA